MRPRGAAIISLVLIILKPVCRAQGKDEGAVLGPNIHHDPSAA